VLNQKQILNEKLNQNPINPNHPGDLHENGVNRIIMASKPCLYTIF
jgi:hypothetical protein